MTNKFTRAHDLKICIIGDEDSVTGFLMAGIGMRDPQGRTNFFIVDGKTRKAEIEECWKDFIARSDTGIVVITQHVADTIRYLVDLHSDVVPTILEIPSKDHPYEATKDSVMQRVSLFFGGQLPE
eukprot:GHVU01106029.1.p2 GENE.GHVU01106029.1~~GHVU01106029.1.p2  ORF type:complete len:125 (-),score=16.74 GHVU01106029.1:1359-1733(-)